MMTKTIIFDYDGTIHHTLGIYEPAFRETYQWLTEQKVTEEREIGSVEIAGWLGLNSKEMWNTFLPELDQSYKEQASTMVGDLMIRQIRKHKAVWYPGEMCIRDSTYSLLSKRITHEDVLSIVDTYFMPYGIESDQYSVLGEIMDVTLLQNRFTEENVYSMEIMCNDILFSVCINQKDLLGEPEVGRRFKGNIWMQGSVKYRD